MECMILMRKHKKKYFDAQSRHTQGTVVAWFLESLGTVLAHFMHFQQQRNGERRFCRLKFICHHEKGRNKWK